jgi:hypothetical protein
MAHAESRDGDEAWSLDEARAQVRAMVSSPLLYVGAVTVVVANELVEWLVGWAGLAEVVGTLLLFPVTLAVLYAQLVLLAYYRRGRSRRDRRTG